MGCLILYNKEYTGNIINMAEDKKQDKNSNAKKNANQTKENSKQSQSVDELVKKLEEMNAKLEELSQKSPAEKILGNWKVMFTTALAVVSGVIGAAMYIFSSFNTINTNIATIQKDIGALTQDFNEIKTNVEKMDNYLYFDGGVKDQLGMINEALNIKVINVTDENASSAIQGASIERKDVDYVTSPLTGETCIGVDANGNIYMAKDLIGEIVLLTYEEGDKEVYFLGQYNENYHWDGYCVTNAYNADGTLYGICESNFDDGKRLDYISLYASANNEWIYADRKVVDGENIGVTINYYIDDNNVKNFTSTNVRITDILYADNYISKVETRMTKYYTGNTVDNIFSDSSGTAYEVKYDADGTVKMLYVGKFVNGYCADASGNAFSIVYSDEMKSYFCNTGEFVDGHAVNRSTDSISQDEINEIIKDYSFDCELKWKE